MTVEEMPVKGGPGLVFREADGPLGYPLVVRVWEPRSDRDRWALVWDAGVLGGGRVGSTLQAAIDQVAGTQKALLIAVIGSRYDLSTGIRRGVSK